MGALAVGCETPTATILFARVDVLKPVITPECGGALSRRRHGHQPGSGWSIRGALCFVGTLRTPVSGTSKDEERTSFDAEQCL